MASFTFTPHQMVRTPSMSVPHPQQLLQAAEGEPSQPRGLNPVNPAQDSVPVQATVTATKAEFSNPDHAQAAVLANSETQVVTSGIVRRAEGPVPYDPTAPAPPPEASYMDEFFDLSALPDAAPTQSAADVYDKSRGLFGAPNQKFGRY